MRRPRQMDSPQQTVEAALNYDVAAKGEITPCGQLDELKDSAVESRHRAVSRDEIEIGLEQIEQVKGAEGEAPRGDPHEDECQPRRSVEKPVEQLQERHRSPRFLALDDHAARARTALLRLARRLCYRSGKPGAQDRDRVEHGEKGRQTGSRKLVDDHPLLRRPADMPLMVSWIP